MFYYFYPNSTIPLNYLYPNYINTFISAQQSPQAQIGNFTNSFEQQSLHNQMYFPQKIILTKEDLEQAGYQVTKKAWDQQEDKLLLFLRDQKKLDWCQIQKKLPQRNKKMCYSRYRRLSNKTMLHWSKKEDQKLLRLVEEFGENWIEIIKHFKSRNLRQIKEHYNNYLRPGLIESDWTLQDDLKLIQLVNKHGKNWKVIQKLAQDRSIIQIKNRYYGRISRLNQNKLSKYVENQFSS